MTAKSKYLKYLTAYFVGKYGQYDEDVEWFNNPAENEWLFNVPALGKRVHLTCDNEGNITEEATTL